MAPTPKPNEERFWAFVDTSGDCWQWVGAIKANGYGQFMEYVGVRKMRARYAHRFAYEFVKGPVPEGLDLDHLCRNRACCNPDHLEPVDRRTNLQRGLHKNRGKTHCLRGHAYDSENTIVRPNGSRTCRACAKGKWARNRAKKSA